MLHFIDNKKLPDMSSITLVFHKAATLFEKPGQRGAMHLLEHLACIGLKEKEQSLTRDGIHWNAFTCQNAVLFEFSGLHDYLVPHIPGILKGLKNAPSTWTQENFDKEQQVVLQELSEGFSSPPEAATEVACRKHYGTLDPGGYPEGVARLTLKAMKALHKKVLSKPTKITIVAPEGMDTSEWDLETDDSPIKYKPLSPFKDDHGLPMPKGMCPKAKDVMLLMTKVPYDTLNETVADLAIACLYQDMHSPIYSSLREKHGFVYSVYPQNIVAGDQAHVIFIAQTAPEKMKDMSKVWTALHKKPSELITKERFELVRDSAIVQQLKADIFKYKMYEETVVAPERLPRYNLGVVTLKDVQDFADKYLSMETLHKMIR